MRAKVNKNAIKILAACIAVLAVFTAGFGFVLMPAGALFAEGPADGTKAFSSEGNIGSRYYRIPALLTAQDGTLIAAMDARFGGTADSPNNLDTAVSTSTDNGATWTDRLAFSFADWESASPSLLSDGSLRILNSASVIDPSLLQDGQTGRVFMLVDAFPYATGFSSSQTGSGYTEVDGEKRLTLRKNGEENYDYTVRGDGAIYDKNGQKTAYSLNSRGEILENGTPLTITQKRQHYWYTVPFATGTGQDVPMHIFYRDALFQAYPTSYLYLMWSDDNGRTWSDPVDLNAQVKSDDVGFTGVCPGRGIQIKNGAHAGRLIFPVYSADPETGDQFFSVIYSDDHGATWAAGEPVTLNETVGACMSETQLVQFADGSLQAFSRTQAGFVGTACSADGGMTWQDAQLIDELPLAAGSGCQLSAINYAGKIDGKDAVLLSAPAGDGRTNGFIHVGLIEENAGRYSINWTYKTEVTDANTYFAYSCLTQLSDGSVGLLYEQSNVAQSVDTTLFKTFTVTELTASAVQ